MKGGVRYLMARMAAAARTLASLLATAIILGGTAAAMVMWAGWPLPHRWPTAHQWATFADQPLNHLSIKTIAAVAGWLLWLLLVASLALEAWIRFTRRPPPLILPRPMRVLAAGMLGTSVVAVATSAHATPPVASPSSVHHPPIHENKLTQPASPHSTSRLAPAHTADETGDFADAPDIPGPAGSPSANIRRQGVDVPGGWIVWPVAAGVLAATAITLLRSRAFAPASALPRAIRAARHSAADPAGEEPSAATEDDIAILEQDATTALPLTIGLREATDIGIDALPADGVALTGPGSTDALRGILAAAATSTNATIVIPADLLHALTGAQLSLPGVTATQDAHAAMHSLQIEIHRRYTLTHEPNPATENTNPPLLLLIEPTAQPRRLAALAELGSDLNIRVVISGPWNAGDTWSVDENGHTTAGTATIGRINTLNPQGLAQLAEALHQTTELEASSDEVAPPEPSAAAIFHLSILGPPRLATSSNPAIHIRRSGSRQIAVYLALHPDGAGRDELLEHIFGHMTMSSATTSLHSCLYELRRLLAAADGGSALRRLDDTYRLDPQLITVDWWQLLHHLRRGDLTQATTQYTGHIADGHTWPWLPEHRQHARHLIADAHATLARTATTPGQALTHALAGITIDPYSTASHDAAIDAYTRLGQADHAQALREELAKRLTRLHRIHRQRSPA